MQLGDQCSSDEDCNVGLGCFKCGIDVARCVRSNITDQFSIVVSNKQLLNQTLLKMWCLNINFNIYI